jgi:hypothetical protein
LRPFQKALLVAASARPRRLPRREAVGSSAPRRSLPWGLLGLPLRLRGVAALGPLQPRGWREQLPEGGHRRPRSAPAPFQPSGVGSPPRPASARPPMLAPALSARRQRALGPLQPRGWQEQLSEGGHRRPRSAQAPLQPRASGVVGQGSGRRRLQGSGRRRLQGSGRRRLQGSGRRRQAAASGRRARVPPLVLPLGGASDRPPGRGVPGVPRACGAPGNDSLPRLRVTT